MENILKYDDFLNEKILSDKDIEKLTSVGGRNYGIAGVSFWFGDSRGVLVGNALNNISLSEKNNFTITLPNFKIIGKNELTENKINDIMKFLKINMKYIIDFNNGKIDEELFFKNIKSV